jgi:hypothetical protein
MYTNMYTHISFPLLSPIFVVGEMKQKYILDWLLHENEIKENKRML